MSKQNSDSATTSGPSEAAEEQKEQKEQKKMLAGTWGYDEKSHNRDRVDIVIDWGRVYSGGPTGVMWVINDPRNNKTILVKKFEKVFDNITNAKNTLKELKLLSFVDHENVLRILELVQPPSVDEFTCAYVAMDLIPLNLCHTIEGDEKRLSRQEIAMVIYQIVRGLRYLHAAGIVHGDIRPGNILLDSKRFAKISNFSLSGPTDSEGMAQHIITSDIVGLSYRSPEILMQSKKLIPASDIWSLGCVLAELLKNHTMFCSADIPRHLDMIIRIVGTPEPTDLLLGIQEHIDYVKQKPRQVPLFREYFKNVPLATPITLHFLSKLLSFSAEKRATIETLLSDPYVEEGRAQFHPKLCECCFRDRDLSVSLEPTGFKKFDLSYQSSLFSIHDYKVHMYKHIMEDAQPTGLKCDNKDNLVVTFFL